MKHCWNCVNLKRVTRQINYDDGGKDIYSEWFCTGSKYLGYLVEDLPEFCSEYLSCLKSIQITLSKAREEVKE